MAALTSCSLPGFNLAILMVFSFDTGLGLFLLSLQVTCKRFCVLYLVSLPCVPPCASPHCVPMSTSCLRGSLHHVLGICSAFLASQTVWLCWPLGHEQHTRADPTSVGTLEDRVWSQMWDCHWLLTFSFSYKCGFI